MLPRVTVPPLDRATGALSPSKSTPPQFDRPWTVARSITERRGPITHFSLSVCVCVCVCVCVWRRPSLSPLASSHIESLTTCYFFSSICLHSKYQTPRWKTTTPFAAPTPPSSACEARASLHPSQQHVGEAGRFRRRRRRRRSKTPSLPVPSSPQRSQRPNPPFFSSQHPPPPPPQQPRSSARRRPRPCALVLAPSVAAETVARAGASIISRSRQRRTTDDDTPCVFSLGTPITPPPPAVFFRSRSRSFPKLNLITQERRKC